MNVHMTISPEGLPQRDYLQENLKHEHVAASKGKNLQTHKRRAKSEQSPEYLKSFIEA